MAYAGGRLTSEQAAWLGAGVDPATVWRWRQEDAAFDDQVRQVQDTVADLRTAMIEDSAFATIIAGQASPGLIKSWLEARHPAWRRRGAGDEGPERDDGTPRVPVEVLRRLMERRDRERGGDD